MPVRLMYSLSEGFEKSIFFLLKKETRTGNLKVRTNSNLFFFSKEQVDSYSGAQTTNRKRATLIQTMKYRQMKNTYAVDLVARQ